MSTINLNTTTASSGTGIDVSSVVDQILYTERAPERLWQQQQTTLKSQATVLTGINSNMASLSSSANALKDILGAIAAKTATSSQNNILTASAQPSASAGIHVIKVANLASTSTYYTDAVASGAVLAPGTIQIQVGASTTRTVSIGSTNNTVSTLASSINESGLGLTASVIRDSTGERLALTSNTSGELGDITVAGNSTGLSFHKSVTGHNASFTLDGVGLSTATNTVSGALEGVTINLASAAPDTEVLLTVAADQRGAEQAVRNFVSSYNLVVSAINGQFATGGDPSTAGPLASSGSLRTLESTLLSAATYSIDENGGLVNLASLGIDMGNDGTLTVDSTKLDDAINNHFTQFKNFFQAAGNAKGFAQNFSNIMSGLTDSTNGLLALNLTENVNQQHILTRQINDMEDRLSNRQKQLIDQYSRVDTMLRQLPLLQAQITAQLNSVTKA